MATDLVRHIRETPLVDTHEHLKRETEWLRRGPDILQDLFDNYVTSDLRTAGATPDAMQRLLNASDPDIAGRFQGIEAAWRATQFTGYGEAVRLIAGQVYGLDELSGDALAAAAGRTAELRRPGERYRLLHDVANLDQVQTDDMCWPCLPDHSGLDFFLYDLSWFGLCSGDVEPRPIYEESGVEVTDLASLNRAMETIFEKHAPCAIAVKSQHAYRRTLQWTERSAGDAAAALDAVLRRPPEQIDVATCLCLGDWCWARGVELAIEHDLPFKIHTGYYAGNDRMPTPWIPAGNMCALFERYPDARFVLMHIAYPYCDELAALAKQGCRRQRRRLPGREAGDGNRLPGPASCGTINMRASTWRAPEPTSAVRRSEPCPNSGWQLPFCMIKWEYVSQNARDSGRRQPQLLSVRTPRHR